MNPKKPTPRHVIIKVAKVKDKEINLRAAREMQLVTYKGAAMWMSADFSKKHFRTWDWYEIFKVMKSKAFLYTSNEISERESRKK